MSKLNRVLIAGGGIGGLALAQALRRGGIEVAVFEKNPPPTGRNEGFRIHIDADGVAAMAQCLPPEVYDLVRRTSGMPNDWLGGYTDQLQQVMGQTFPLASDDAITHVDRGVFRRALLTGLDDVVQYERAVAGYEITDARRVRVEFADGGAEEGDVLVGADGVGSAVRRQLLPQVGLQDLGLRCVYGRMPITRETEGLIPQDFDRGMCWVSDPDKCGAGFAPMRFRVGAPVGDEASDYLATSLVAAQERLGVADERLFALPSEQLWKLAVAQTAQWHPALRELFEHADPNSFAAVAMRAGERIDGWEQGPVTLLGDAVHTMPPTGGIGASTALQDAATLAELLLKVEPGEHALLDALDAYERVMLPRGFANIDMSLRNAEMMFAEHRW